jgi:hypothetical protein
MAMVKVKVVSLALVLGAQSSVMATGMATVVSLASGSVRASASA